MLSKFIYKSLIVVALAFFAQVGYSQNYVDLNIAMDRLEEAITELETDLASPPVKSPVTTGQLYASNGQTEGKLKLQLMKAVSKDLDALKDVKDVMDSWYEKAELEGPERKTKMIIAIDSVRDLLS